MQVLNGDTMVFDNQPKTSQVQEHLWTLEESEPKARTTKAKEEKTREEKDSHGKAISGALIGLGREEKTKAKTRAKTKEAKARTKARKARKVREENLASKVFAVYVEHGVIGGLSAGRSKSEQLVQNNNSSSSNQHSNSLSHSRSGQSMQ